MFIQTSLFIAHLQMYLIQLGGSDYIQQKKMYLIQYYT